MGRFHLRLHICLSFVLLAALAGVCTPVLADAPSAGAAADSTMLIPHTYQPGDHPYSPSRLTPGPPRPRKIGDPSRLFTFAVIGDTHLRLDTPDDPRYLKAMSVAGPVLEQFVADINGHTTPVDFAVHLGDLTDLGKPEEFAMATAAMADLARPLYAVLGNHDNFQSDHKHGWLTFAGVPSPNYSFTVRGFHFVVIDCTLDPYVQPYVDCGPALRDWVAADLEANANTPSIIFCHFNMWLRRWNPMFDTTLTYAEYRGMPELRQVLENAGNVVAVINGHVHANRLEVHNGIYYVDVSATIVGPPSIRYFDVYPDRIEASYHYLSDQRLFDTVTAMCPLCSICFDPDEVCAFIDGPPGDRTFVIPLGPCAGVPPGLADSTATAPPSLSVVRDETGRIRAAFASQLTGAVDISLVDVLGRRLGSCTLWKDGPVIEVDLGDALVSLADMPPGIYFVRASIAGRSATRKLVMIP